MSEYFKGSYIFSVEGNIGSGKSTFVKYLENYEKKDFEEHKNCLFLQEPVKLWEEITDENNIPILTKFYTNPKKYFI